MPPKKDKREKRQWGFVPIGVAIAVGVALAGAAVGYGILKNKVDVVTSAILIHEVRVDKLEADEAASKTREEERWEYIKETVDRIDRRLESIPRNNE